MTIAQNTAAQLDPMAAAMQPKPLNNDRTFFAEITTVDAFYCVLERGIGKRLFDPTVDDVGLRRTAITIIAVPIKGTYDIKQDVLDFSKEWQKYTLPSIIKLGRDLRSLKGAFVQLKKVPTGETYTDKQGQTKDRVALVIVEVYSDRAACQAAADAFFGQFKKSGEETDDTPPAPPAAPAPASDTSTAERAFAAQSLPLLWQASGQNITAFHQMIASTPMIAKHFNAQSPEVLALTGGVPF